VGIIPEENIETFDIKVKTLDESLTKQVTELKEDKVQTITDITKINKRINSKHIQYKKSITKTGDSFKNNLSRKYTDYFQKATTVKNNFLSIATRFSNSQYLAVGILLLCIIFFLTHLPSISDVFQDPIFNGIIPLLLVIVLITFIIFTRETYQKLKEIKPEPVESLTTELSGVEYSDVEQYDFQDDIIEQMRCTDQLVSSTQSALDIIASKIPIYKDYVEDDHFRRKWELGCDEYQNALKFFGLDYKSQFQQLRDKPNFRAKRADESVFDQTILEDFSTNLFIPSEIITIYIKYYRGENTRLLWDEIKKEPSKIKTISKQLYDSNQIDIDRSRLSEDEFQQIIKRTQEFSIGQLSKNSSLFVQIKLKIENYKKILVENDVSLSDSGDNLINLIDFNLSFEQNFLNILSTLLDPILPTSNTHAYKNAIIAILLNDEILFKDKVCRNAAEDETIFVLMTYHELLREIKENNQIFKLNDLLENVQSLESTKARIKTDLELQKRFAFFKNDLSRGYWWDDGLSLQRKMFDDLKQDFNEKIETLDRSIIITKLLEKTFTEININTVDKAIDANLFSTYLILSTSHKGRLLEFLDTISIRRSDLSRKGLSELRFYEERYGITLIRDGKPKYDFTNYSHRTRIGVLPRNTIFLDFVQELKNDIDKILQVESQELDGEMEGIGLAFIRVTPSKYSFGLLDDDIEKYCDVTTRDLHIAKIIAVLARDYTSNSEQCLLSAFDGKINLTEIFNQMSILELIQTRDMDISDEYARFLRSDELKKAILSSLAEEGISSIRGLSRTVRSSRENRRELESIIREVIIDEYLARNNGIMIQTTRLNTLVNELMKSLDSIAYLMENIS
jgi:hypothetical protein